MRAPAVSADAVTISDVRRASTISAITAFGASSDALVVERPVGARADAIASVFVFDTDRLVLRRVAVEYGRASSSWIQILGGVSPGDRIVVSDMRAWDAFDRLRVRMR